MIQPMAKPNEKLTKPQLRLEQFSKRLLKKCEKAGVDFLNSNEYNAFLYFASYTLNDKSLYPYWCYFSLEQKNNYLCSVCVNNNIFSEANSLILENKNDFWSYMNEILYFKLKKFSSEYIYVDTYLPNIINIILSCNAYPTEKDNLSDNIIESLVNNSTLIDCENFFCYLERLFDKINQSFEGLGEDTKIFVHYNSIDLSRLMDYKLQIKETLRKNTTKILEYFGNK